MNSSQVCKLNFPLYCCESLGDESFLVAGGGGAAKTGVKNSIVSEETSQIYLISINLKINELFSLNVCMLNINI